MNNKFIIFDLDGTISDPKEGIVRSMNFSLKSHGLNEKSETDLVKYIGPPLDVVFHELSGSDDGEFILSLVNKYRERYSAIGYSENTIYEGIVENLEILAGRFPLAICTSKRADFAEKILDLFNLSHLFKLVSGGDVGISKSQQLADLLANGAVGQDSIMVGDRNADLIGASSNGLLAIGVLWGYGDYEELSNENPHLILDNPNQLSLYLA